MSEVPEPGRRRQRADARRSAATILETAVARLGHKPDASMDEIATAAHVSRQTIYAHFPSRDALLRAVTAHVTAEVARHLADLDTERGSATEALGRWADAAWSLLERYPVLLTSALVAPDGDQAQSHEPVVEGLRRIIDRGRRQREFDRTRPASWYLAAVVGLGHAAAGEAVSGRMSTAEAGAAFRDAVVKICRAAP